MSLDQKTFKALCDLLYDRTGITLGEGKQALVSARISKRLRALGYTCFKEYYDFLCSETPEANKEFTEFQNVMSTNLTYFFRENEHFEFMGDFVREMVEEGRNKIRIWCAAASTGEEPYTIAMTFWENAQKFRGDFRILATDIDTNVLKTAKKGEYAEGRMKDVPQNLRTKYFTSVGLGANRVYTVKDEIRNQISFAQLNLSKPPFPMKGPFDIIFCRNVMIYFDDVVRKRLIAEFEHLLRPGGYLIVAHSESIVRLTTLKSVQPSVWYKQ